MSDSDDTDCKYCMATFDEQKDRLQHMADEHEDEITNLDETLIQNHEDVTPPGFVSRKNLILQGVIITAGVMITVGLLYLFFLA